MLMLSLIVMAWCQEPAPEPPTPEPPSQSEQEPRKISQEEVEEKVAQVTATFVEADRSLTSSVETPQEKLAEAAAATARLVAEMEELLEILPEPPPPPPDSGEGQGNQQAPDKPPPSDDSHSNQKTPPRDMPLSEFLRDPRDDSWGKLPPRLQQTIDSSSAEEVPLRYRRWLVEYHRQGIKSEK